MAEPMGSMAPFPPGYTNHSNHSTPTFQRKQNTATDAVQGANRFGLNVFRQHITDEKQDVSVIMSPKSFITPLQIVALGSFGRTQTQIENALGGIPLGCHHSTNQSFKGQRHKIKTFAVKTKAKILSKMPSFDGTANNSHPTECPYTRSNSTEEGAPYNLVNKVCIRKGLTIAKGFTDGAKSIFGAKTESLDFQGHPDRCRENINAWVLKHTEGKVKDMLSSDDVTTATSMIIVNAVYFKGDWEDKFDKQVTHKRAFKTPGGDVYTDFMFRKGDTLFCDDRELRCRAVELPYTGRDLSFVAILPDPDSSLEYLESRLNIDALQHIFKAMQTVSDLLLYLPKFKLETSLELSSSFEKLGIIDMFTEGQADLRGIEPKGLLFVSGIAHKACIEVNEEGCEAAAATAAILKSAGGPEKVYTEFEANRPFLFLIKDNSSDMILFMGRFCHPD